MVVGVVLAAVGCSAPVSDEEISPDALRTNPSATVPTDDASVRLLSGYNAFLDRATTTGCVAPLGEVAPQVGDVRGQFYMRHVKTRDDLAKELDVDVSASVKVPQASVDAATKIVRTFKQSSTTVTFLVRAVRSYVVANRAELALTPDARALLAQNETKEFLSKCGGSFAKNVRYEAQVIGILQFEATTEETARSIQTSLGGETPSFLQQVGSARADIQTKATQTAEKYKAQLSLTVSASGFLARGQSTNNVAEQSFEKIDELREQMNRSFDDDIARDRAGYATNTSRNVRPASVGQASYAQLSNAPASTDYTRITATLTRAEEFARDVAAVQLRLQNTHEDEVARFLRDVSNQFRYNIPGAPKLRSRDLVPIAEDWSRKLHPERGSLVEPLKLAIERCMAAASNGDYSACTTDDHLETAKARADAALADYARSGRIVPMNAWMPTLGETMSFRNADDACLSVSMRLPKREEMRVIAPAVSALSSGQVWFAADAGCAKPYFANGSGEGAYGCGETVAEPLPYVQDRGVVCVGRSGPAPVLAPP